MAILLVRDFFKESMESKLLSLQNDDDDTGFIPLVKVKPESLIETSIVPDLNPTETGEEMIMVDPGLVTGRTQEVTKYVSKHEIL